MFFTMEEKRMAYKRLRSGYKPRCAYLIHIMKHASYNVSMIKEIDPILANKLDSLNRLVERGLITTLSKYQEVAYKLTSHR